MTGADIWSMVPIPVGHGAGVVGIAYSISAAHTRGVVRRTGTVVSRVVIFSSSSASLMRVVFGSWVIGHVLADNFFA